MAISPLAAQWTHSGTDKGASIRTLIWLTIKQHRFEALAIVSACIVLAAAALVEAYRLGDVQVSVACLATWPGPGVPPAGSTPPDAAAIRCNQLATAFFDIRNGIDFHLTQQLIAFAPLVAGVVLGAPFAAREVEQGTAQTSWVHGVSRRPWFGAKIFAGLILLVPGMLALGLSANVLEGAATPSLDPYASFDAYLDRGVLTAVWAVAAFTGTFALGAILGRTIPALIVGVVICAVARFAWDDAMTHVVLRPFAVAQGPRDYSASPYFAPEPDMPIRLAYYLDGQPFYGDVYQWYAEHDPGVIGGAGPSPSPGPSSSPGPTPGSSGSKGLVLVAFVIPGSWYWGVVLVESGLLLAGSAIATGVGWVWTNRRRPY